MKESHSIQEIQKRVPRETLRVLEKFVELLLKWNKQINLISRKSEDKIWFNHVLDSLEALKHITNITPTVLDVGSGAGFPGMILSIVTGWHTILVEKSHKKCMFLKEAQLITGANVTIENQLIEKLEKYHPNIIVSRGVANIKTLLDMIEQLLHHDCQVILWKGHEWQTEIAAALNNSWNFKFECHKSKIRGMIVILSNFTKHSG